MNKKGVIWEDVADLLLGGLILMTAVMSFTLMTGYGERQVDLTFEQNIVQLSNDEIFSSYLQSYSSDILISDHITMAHINNDADYLTDQLDTFFTYIYEDEVCWNLYKEGTKWAHKHRCRNEDTLLDAFAVVPIPHADAIELRLEINGYAN